MKANEVKEGRYVARLGDGRITIVSVTSHGKGWRVRCERTHRFVSMTARRLWRPACDFESWDDATVQGFSCAEHRAMWDGEDVCLPVVEYLDVAEATKSASAATPARSVTEELYLLSLEEARRNVMAMAGC